MDNKANRPMPPRVAYIVNSFPEPSETFVVDEMESVRALGVDAWLLHLRQSKATVVPSQALAIQQAGRAKRLDHAALGTCLRLLAARLAAQPLTTLPLVWRVARHSHRWIYLQALEAARWCETHDIELLHAHFAAENFIYAKAISDWTGIPYSVTTHRYDLFEQPLPSALLDELYGGASAIITISDYNKQFMLKAYGLPDDRVAVVHCGIDPHRFAYRAQPCHWSGRPLRLLNVGRLVPVKAQDVLLRAVRSLMDGGIDVELEVVGGGPLQTELAQQAKALGVADRVTWHGAQSDVFVREALCRADVFVLPSRAEGLPVALMEAMASGVPVITTRIYGIPELVVHEESGLLVPPDNEVELCRALAWAAAHPEELNSMRAAARVAVVDGFDRARCSRDLIKCWRAADALAN